MLTISVRSLIIAPFINTMLKGAQAMLIGYARVSTVDQNLDLQHDALAKAEWGKD